MKKTLLAVALAVATLSASAHPLRSTHYHDTNGRVVLANNIADKVVTTYETDARGRRVRVVTTTECIDERRNPRNNHLRCLESEVSVERSIERPGGIGGGTGPGGMPRVEPVIYRTVEMDQQGRRIIVTTTFTCVRSGYNSPDQPVCYQWQRSEDREYVRWDRRDRERGGLDLNGDGRTDGWERLLFEGFREVLENN